MYLNKIKVFYLKKSAITPVSSPTHSHVVLISQTGVLVNS